MARQNHSDTKKSMSDEYLSATTTTSSSTLEILLDEQSLSNSSNDDSNSQHRVITMETSRHEHLAHRRRKHLSSRAHQFNSNGNDSGFSAAKKDKKSHRLIEKRRRDRMNACLDELLELLPHEHIDSQRRIEKTEIIEIAIKHLRHLTSTAARTSEEKCEKSNLEIYRTGYRNCLSDLIEYLEEYFDHDQRLTDLTEHLKEKETELKYLTVIPNQKRPTYSIESEKKRKLSSSSTKFTPKTNFPHKPDENLCVSTQIEGCKSNDRRFSIETNTSITSPIVKVPIFVLHPSGTHYIPMSVDASIVSHAFTKTASYSSSTSSLSPIEHVQCHPVSIPVNFNPITSLTDPYELDVQNINVIGTRHQTSVQPT